MEDAKNLAKTYNPQEFEDKLYNNWVTKGYFHAEADKTKKPFTIVIGEDVLGDVGTDVALGQVDNGAAILKQISFDAPILDFRGIKPERQ